MWKHGRKMINHPLTNGEVSLVLNNIELLRKIKEKYTTGYFLILESDFELLNNFFDDINAILNYINDSNLKFDIINVGTGFRKNMIKDGFKYEEEIEINQNLKLQLYSNNCQAEALIWNIDSINKFLEYFDKDLDINGPWDTILDNLKKIYWSSIPSVRGLSVIYPYNVDRFKSTIH